MSFIVAITPFLPGFSPRYIRVYNAINDELLGCKVELNSDKLYIDVFSLLSHIAVIPRILRPTSAKSRLFEKQSGFNYAVSRKKRSA